MANFGDTVREIWKRDADVRTCRCTVHDRLTCIRFSSDGSLAKYQISILSQLEQAVYEDGREEAPAASTYPQTAVPAEYEAGGRNFGPKHDKRWQNKGAARA